MPSDEELMLAVGKGELAAFGEIVSRHQAAAWNLAYRFLGDGAAAEDIAQDAFLRILDAAPRYRPTASFRTYLHQVVVRLCLDHARRKRPAAWDGAKSATAGVPSRGHGWRANRGTLPSPSPLDALVTAERDAAVRRAVEALPANQRMAVVLRYYEGMAGREVAEAMGTTPKAVERLLARARAALGTALGAFLEKW